MLTETHLVNGCVLVLAQLLLLLLVHHHHHIAHSRIVHVHILKHAHVVLKLLLSLMLHFMHWCKVEVALHVQVMVALLVKVIVTLEGRDCPAVAAVLVSATAISIFDEQIAHPIHGHHAHTFANFTGHSHQAVVVDIHRTIMTITTHKVNHAGRRTP